MEKNGHKIANSTFFSHDVPVIFKIHKIHAPHIYSKFHEQAFIITNFHLFQTLAYSNKT
jgi:hypothetical protein